jgi:hypothetical protein
MSEADVMGPQAKLPGYIIFSQPGAFFTFKNSATLSRSPLSLSNDRKIFETKTATSMLGLRHYGVKGGVSRWASRASSSLCISIQHEVRLGSRTFSLSALRYKKQDDPEQDEKRAFDKPKIRPKARQTSLRRVGIEAERSRQIIQDKGGLRIIDPDIETKACSPR